MNDTLAPPSESRGAHYQITLVRHGETFSNRNQIVQGQDPTQGRLTEEGIQQARLVGQALVDRQFEIAYCSPLERAVLTMGEILVPRKGERTLPLVFPEALREINQGALSGRPHIEWKAAMVGQDPMTFRAPGGGESWEDVQARVLRYFRQVILAGGQRNILIVAHGGVNRGLLAYLTGLTIGESWRGAGVGCPQDNSCINELVLDAKGRLLEALVNDCRHLAGWVDAPSQGQRWVGGKTRWEILGPPSENARAKEFDPYG